MPEEVDGVSSTYHMFYGCDALKGMNGTTLATVQSTLRVSEDAATSGTYAVLDEGISSSSPGYLTGPGVEEIESPQTPGVDTPVITIPIG
jgi:hypothetical protein